MNRKVGGAGVRGGGRGRQGRGKRERLKQGERKGPGRQTGKLTGSK